MNNFSLRTGLENPMRPPKDDDTRSVSFDRIDRRSFLFPNLTAQEFDLFTIPVRFLNGGEITHVGITSPQLGFFADNLYVFTAQKVQPITFQLANNDSPTGAAASEQGFFTYRGVGTLDNLKPMFVKLQSGYTFRLFILGRAGVPATGFLVVNVYVRTVGRLYR